MSKGNRVFITGRSALTACGATADDTWAAITAGKSGIGDERHRYTRNRIIRSTPGGLL